MHEIWRRSPKSSVYIHLICDCPGMYGRDRPHFESVGIAFCSQLPWLQVLCHLSFQDLVATGRLFPDLRLDADL